MHRPHSEQAKSIEDKLAKLPAQLREQDEFISDLKLQAESPEKNEMLGDALMVKAELYQSICEELPSEALFTPFIKTLGDACECYKRNNHTVGKYIDTLLLKGEMCLRCYRETKNTHYLSETQATFSKLDELIYELKSQLESPKKNEILGDALMAKAELYQSICEELPNEKLSAPFFQTLSDACEYYKRNNHTFGKYIDTLLLKGEICLRFYHETKDIHYLMEAQATFSIGETLLLKKRSDLGMDEATFWDLNEKITNLLFQSSKALALLGFHYEEEDNRALASEAFNAAISKSLPFLNPNLNSQEAESSGYGLLVEATAFLSDDIIIKSLTHFSKSQDSGIGDNRFDEFLQSLLTSAKEKLLKILTQLDISVIRNCLIHAGSEQFKAEAFSKACINALAEKGLIYFTSIEGTKKNKEKINLCNQAIEHFQVADRLAKKHGIHGIEINLSEYLASAHFARAKAYLNRGNFFLGKGRWQEARDVSHLAAKELEFIPKNDKSAMLSKNVQTLKAQLGSVVQFSIQRLEPKILDLITKQTNSSGFGFLTHAFTSEDLLALKVVTKLNELVKNQIPLKLSHEEFALLTGPGQLKHIYDYMVEKVPSMKSLIANSAPGKLPAPGKK